MPRSKRFELLSQRPVNKDSCIHEWPEKGLVNMESPFDPLPGLKIVNGIVKEMDGKKQKDFDLIDHFIVKYAL
ncbi:MAG: propanediol/glycerol family dehydratase large subunit, partial [Thermodesulfobacteriota bacterium]